AITNDQRAGGLAQAPPQRFGVHLLAQAIQALARRHEAPLTDNRPSSRRLAALIEPKAGAGVNPMPTFRLLARATQSSAFTPVIALPDIPGVQLNNHLVRLQRQFQWFLIAGTSPRLFIKLGA